MISLTKLQKRIDQVFTLGQDYRTRQAKEGSQGFYISTSCITKTFIKWMKDEYGFELRNVVSDQDENPDYVKAFFEYGEKKV